MQCVCGFTCLRLRDWAVSDLRNHLRKFAENIHNKIVEDECLMTFSAQVFCGRSVFLRLGVGGVRVGVRAAGLIRC